MTRWADLTDDELGDRLAVELGTLASGADATADSMRGRLLPGVRARIGPRPQRVPGSRFAPVAAIGVVAGLVVLFAVAAPRFGPGSSTPTPEPTPPSEWSALNTRDFSAALAGGGLRGQTVVVIGQLDSVNYYGDPGCAFGEPCERYALAGASPPVLVRSRPLPAPEGAGQQGDVEGVDWELWAWPDDPPDGAALVLSVTDDGLVDYVGWQSDAPMGVESFALVDPASMPQSEIHVVTGWMTAFNVASQQGTSIKGLPRRGFSSYASRLQGPQRPDRMGYFTSEEGVRVQDDAYETFAGAVPRWSGDAEPVAGLWAVAPRLEGGGCPNGEQTCWRWNLVGALLVVPVGPALPVPSPDASPTPGPVDTPEASTASPTPSPSPASTLNCGDIPLTVFDRDGMVEACAAQWVDYDPAAEAVANPAGDVTTLDLNYPALDPESCTDEFYELELGTLEPGDSTAPVIVVPSEYCTSWTTDHPGVRRLAVRLTLGTPVAAETVVLHEAFAERFFRDGDETLHDVTDLPEYGVLRLRLVAARDTFVEGEPLNVLATFIFDDYFDRPVDRVTLHGALAPFGFVYEQLDGDGRYWAPPAPCAPVTLEPTDEISVANDPTLRLEPGKWRISVSASFSDKGCNDAPTRMHAYVIVTVISSELEPIEFAHGAAEP